MTPKRRRNLLRLLAPRHVALIGGRDAVTVAGELKRIGYPGAVWPVNRSRDQIGGHRCYRSLEDLPEAPDAAFVAVPREPAIETVGALARMGAGGAVVYTAGFGEVGAEGAAAEARLVTAAGDLALIGPNCYGMINYAARAALWPFAHGGGGGGEGAAIVTQSGMLSSDLTMSQRAVPFAYAISAGNQAVLSLEDFVDVLAERPEVAAIGLHIEGLNDVPAFERAALKALELAVPIVALKTGSSRIGRRLTVSHTGSLSGTDDLYDALFERLGIIRVASPAQLLETLKFLCIAGVPSGGRLAGFTCSGGSATMLADRAEQIGLTFPDPDEEAAADLRALLPETATVSNPLDYTTPIWGVAERTGPVFARAMAEPCDVALLVQDYPLPGLDESKPAYLADAMSFADAALGARLPAAIVSTLPENLDADIRALLAARGVAPMQGIHDALEAVRGAAWHAGRRAEILAAPPAPLIRVPDVDATSLDEAEGKAILRAAGIDVPAGIVAPGADAPRAAATLGFPVALKMLSAALPHKTEAGAVRVGLTDAAAVADAVTEIRRAVAEFDAGAAADRFLIERAVRRPVAELMVSVRSDRQFGRAMILASGGQLVELIGDAVTLLLPAPSDLIVAALDRLRAARLLAGYRGRPAADREAILNALDRLAAYALDHPEVAEIEINPLFALPEGVIAVDVLARVAR